MTIRRRVLLCCTAVANVFRSMEFFASRVGNSFVRSDPRESSLTPHDNSADTGDGLSVPMCKIEGVVSTAASCSVAWRSIR